MFAAAASRRVATVASLNADVAFALCTLFYMEDSV